MREVEQGILEGVADNFQKLVFGMSEDSSRWIVIISLGKEDNFETLLEEGGFGSQEKALEFLKEFLSLAVRLFPSKKLNREFAEKILEEIRKNGAAGSLET